MTDLSSTWDIALRIAAVEVEAHASDSGWDQPARLFALVPTAELAVAEPELAAELGVSVAAGDLLTPIEQEVDVDEPLERLLARILFPKAVSGAMAVLERVVLPPEVEGTVPEEIELASEFAASHPGHEDVRLVVGVLRSGESHCVLRLRSHDNEDELLHGAELVPGLVAALRTTLDEEHEGEL